MTFRTYAQNTSVMHFFCPIHDSNRWLRINNISLCCSSNSKRSKRNVHGKNNNNNLLRTLRNKRASRKRMRWHDFCKLYKNLLPSAARFSKFQQALFFFCLGNTTTGVNSNIISVKFFAHLHKWNNRNNHTKRSSRSSNNNNNQSSSSNRPTSRNLCEGAELRKADFGRLKFVSFTLKRFLPRAVAKDLWPCACRRTFSCWRREDASKSRRQTQTGSHGTRNQCGQNHCFFCFHTQSQKLQTRTSNGCCCKAPRRNQVSKVLILRRAPRRLELCAKPTGKRTTARL